MSKEEKVMHNIYKSLCSVGGLDKFLSDIGECGIYNNDPRIEELIKSLKDQKDDKTFISFETFSRYITPYLNLMMKYSFREFIIPEFQTFIKVVSDIYEKCKLNLSGCNATYIPQLANVPDYWGISVCTVDGQRHEIGDTKVPFTIQSCSKPLSYAIALETLSAGFVHEYIGHEPSGRMFNEMVLDHNNKPHNPMINSGAIVTASLIYSSEDEHTSMEQKFEFVKSWMQRAAGGEKFEFNESVYLSEREAADRNFALGYFMREHKVFPLKTNMLESLDFYFKLCSIEGTSEALSIIAATLANGGVCPLTEEKIFSPETVRDVLSLLHSCGLYDYSGQFAFKVGLPAKSGVAGAIMLIIPNLVGICCFSPKLNAHGNSVRGIQFCEELLKVYAIHPYDNMRYTNKNLIRKGE